MFDGSPIIRLPSIKLARTISRNFRMVPQRINVRVANPAQWAGVIREIPIKPKRVCVLKAGLIKSIATPLRGALPYEST